MTSPYSLSLFERIKKKNKKYMVTVDSLMENKTYRATDKIVDALKELQAEGLITCRSVLDHGKFATEIFFEGALQHSSIKGTLRKEEEGDNLEDVLDSKPKRKYQRRTVRRSAV